MTMRPRACSETGLSLLGVVIASAVAVMVVGALVGVAQRSGQAARATKERLVATFLAREGIELVRAIRDTNWLATPRCDPLGACVILWRGPASGRGSLCNGTFRVDATTVDASGLVATTPRAEDTRLLLSDATYGHGSGSRTPFKRWLDIRSGETGCGEASISVPPTPAPARIAVPRPTRSPLPSPRVPQPFTVTSTVEWAPPNAGTRRIELEEQLYPWMNVR